MYDPFAPPPAPGTVTTTGLPTPLPTTAPGPTNPGGPAVSGPAGAAGPAPNNAIANFFGNPDKLQRWGVMQRFMPAGMAGRRDWGGQMPPGFNFDGFRDAMLDWRADRPAGPRTGDAWGDWRAQRPDFGDYWNQPSGPIIAPGAVPPITTAG